MIHLSSAQPNIGLCGKAGPTTEFGVAVECGECWQVWDDVCEAARFEQAPAERDHDVRAHEEQ